LVRKTGKLLDIGITATFPSTVLGYTKIGKVFQKKDGVEVYYFAGHTEKPGVKRATKYVTSGDYLWHGNYYMWTPRLFLAAFERYQPTMSRVFESIIAALESKQLKNIPAYYEQLEKIAFDYALTEKIAKKDVLIIKGEFGWSDIGAWDVLHEQLREPEGDVNGNVVKGDVVHIDTKNCLIYGEDKHVVAAVGLENIVIVDTPDALLVCPKNRAQDVKKLLPEIEKRGLKKYL
jgi:mannose-1-phosphate guanylyltransferase